MEAVPLACLTLVPIDHLSSAQSFLLASFDVGKLAAGSSCIHSGSGEKFTQCKHGGGWDI